GAGAVPVAAGPAQVVGDDAVRQARAQSGEVGGVLGEHAAVGQARIEAGEEGDAAGGDEADRVQAAIEGAAAAGFVQVPHQQDDAAALFGQVGERGEHAANLGVAAEVDAGREKRRHRIEDDEAGAGGGDAVAEPGNVVGQ